MNAKPLVFAQALISLNRASLESYSPSGGRQLSGNEAKLSNEAEFIFAVSLSQIGYTKQCTGNRDAFVPCPRFGRTQLCLVMRTGTRANFIATGTREHD